MYLKPDLATFQVFPWTDPGAAGASGARVGRIICDIANPDGTPFAGCPRTTLKRVIAIAAERGFTMKAGPEAEFFLFQRKRREADDRDPRRRWLLRSGAGRSRRGRAPRDRARPRADGFSRRSRASRGRARPARNRLPLRRRARNRRQRQHLPFRRQERGAAQRPARDVHAQADLRTERLRHAHASVAVSRQGQRLSRRQRAVAVERNLPALHRRTAAARQGVLRRHQSARELVQAPRARLRSADRDRVVREESQPAGARSGDARHWRRASSCACRIPPAIRISRWRSCCAPGSTASIRRSIRARR